MTWKLTSAVPVWILAVLGAVLVAVISVPAQYATWLAIVFAACVLATFGIQLALARSDGFVTRAMSSIGGALIVLAVTTLLLRVVV